MAQSEQEYTKGTKIVYDMVLSDRAVDKLMGPDPIPCIDIEEDEI